VNANDSFNFDIVHRPRPGYAGGTLAEGAARPQRP
jgi:hypothetical protein